MNGLEEAKSIINKVLQRSEFQPPEAVNLSWLKKIKDFINNIIDRIMSFIEYLLEKIFGKMKFKPGNLNNKYWEYGIIIFRILLLLTFITMIIFIYVKLVKNKRWNKRLKDFSEKEIEEFVNNEDLPYSLAEKYKAEGDLRLSLRYLFISLLVQLNKKEIIQIYKSKTNRQYYREIRKNCPDISWDFYNFSDAFAFHWYGLRPVEPVTLDKWFSAYHDILERGVKSDGKN